MTMSWRFIKYVTSLILSGLIINGCIQSDYTKLVKSELAKGIRNDSILLGISFGDTRNEFFGKCFDLNKMQLVTQGPANSSVQYIFTDSSVHKEPTQIRLLFYPSFDQKEKITNMDLEFSYTGWAPWNTKLQSDSLKVKVMELLKKWYGGNEFVTANTGDTQLPVKLDANRRILIFIKDQQSVTVKIQDILHPKYMHSISQDKIKDPETQTN